MKTEAKEREKRGEKKKLPRPCTRRGKIKPNNPFPCKQVKLETIPHTSIVIQHHHHNFTANSHPCSPLASSSTVDHQWLWQHHAGTLSTLKVSRPLKLPKLLFSWFKDYISNFNSTPLGWTIIAIKPSRLGQVMSFFFSCFLMW